MAMPKKQDPLKYCQYCGSLLERKRFLSGRLEDFNVFMKRKYCNQTCMAKAFDARPSRSAETSTCHYHARKLVPQGVCEVCGCSVATDVHHKNGDFTNNNPDNLMRICRSCHNKMHRKKKTCVICGNPQKGHGYCSKHLIRFKKYGNPHLVKVNQHGPVFLSED